MSVETGSDGGWNLALLFLLALLAAPVEYLVHESAHLLTARYFGAEAVLHFDRVTLGAGAELTSRQRLLFIAAGPATDAMVGLAGLLLLLKRYTPLRLVLAIWLARPLQFLPPLLGLDASAFALAAGFEGTDEGQVAHALGLTPQAVVWAELAVVAPLLALIVYCLPAARRLAILAVLCIGVSAGWVGWLAWAPLVLP